MLHFADDRKTAILSLSPAYGKPSLEPICAMLGQMVARPIFVHATPATEEIATLLSEWLGVDLQLHQRPDRCFDPWAIEQSVFYFMGGIRGLWLDSQIHGIAHLLDRIRGIAPEFHAQTTAHDELRTAASLAPSLIVTGVQRTPDLLADFQHHQLVLKTRAYMHPTSENHT